MNKKILTIGLLFFASHGWAQETFPRNDVNDDRSDARAFTNATIFVDANTKLEGATLLIREGVIEQVGTNVTVPKGYIEIDLGGKYIYPALIDIYSSYGLPDPPKRGRFSFNRAEQIEPKTEGAYNANDAIKSHYRAADHFNANEKESEGLRKLGFGTVVTYMADGLARGSSALVSLGDDSANNLLLKADAAAHYAFDKGSSSQSYPISLMGFISLLRQTYLDADWYGKQNPKPFTDRTLDAWLRLGDLPQIFEVRDKLSILRADKLGDEFGKQYIIKSGGDAYQRLDEVKATNAPLIVPVNFPDPPDVEDPLDARRVTLADMKHWELAPTNPAALERAGIRFALTTHGLKEKKSFWSQLRKAIEHGLSEEAALRGLTQTPAALLGMGDRLGSLKQGALANFIIVSQNIFDEKAVIHENWIQGKPYVVESMDVIDHSGKYQLKIGQDLPFDLEVTGAPGKHKVSIPSPSEDEAEADESEDAEEETDAENQEADAAAATAEKKPGGKDKGIEVKAKFEGNLVSLSFTPEKDKGAIRLSGWVSGRNWKGSGELPDGTWITWQAEFQEETQAKEKPAKEKKDLELGKLIYPFEAYGWETPPQAETLLIQGATVWTLETDGVLTETDVLVKDGKISQIGKGLEAGGARVIDGSGMHLTPGIVDEHSHIALNNVNDVATNSGMVRMGDVVDSEDVNIYRQLAGGVTAAQLLHGSANPVGGQSALIKMRWGSPPAKMLIQGADGFIKFALGENVKRSRNRASIRYPQTRMGVEQVYMDAFTRARDYEKKWNAYNGLSARAKAKTTPPRRDLVLDTMVEILNGKRFITCHSYVQSEINMLMKVAERFGFRVNTFTHILEGYKVADKMAAHGAGGSTFADWWAYKWEVRYAIPYGPTLMHGAGVVTAVNSDSAEMARRLNQEAAKSVKYGGMSEEDALKLVTLNPARLLHLDDRMGSIKVGKDADLVLWSDHPLSIYAVVQLTLVDGIPYFEKEKDLQLRAAIQAERARLIDKIRKAGKGGKKSKSPRFPRRPNWHCDDLFELHGGTP